MGKKIDLKEQLRLAEEQRLRALADYQNLEKRITAQQQHFVRLSTSAFILKLLPVVDHLERAAKHLKDQGLDMILKQIGDLLLTEEVKPMEVIGKAFDHLQMEGVEQVEGEKDKVIELVEAGYFIGDQILRPAKVKVGNGQLKQD
jgi:molecular chaperone GrpE